MILLAVTACGKHGDDGDGAERETPVRPVEGRLDKRMKAAADDGKGFSLKDATSLNRYISPAQARDFKACYARDRPEISAVDLFAVPRAESCPARLGEEALPGKTPKVLGLSVREASNRLTAAGYSPQSISVNLEGEGADTVEEHRWSWQVCEQSPAAGTLFSADSNPRLVAKASCSSD